MYVLWYMCVCDIVNCKSNLLVSDDTLLNNLISKVTIGDQCLLCWFSPYLSRQEILNVM